MADGNDTRLRIARPTFKVDGQEQGPLASALLELSVEESTDGLYRCEATFGNLGPKDGGTGFLYFDRKLLDFGKTFSVWLGTDVLFEGRITALEGLFLESSPPAITVLAEDRFQDLRMTRRTATYVDVTDKQIIERLAGKHGLTPDVQVRGPTHAILAQVNQSDLAFLRERCRAVDAELWMEGRTLHAKHRAARAQGQALKLGMGNELREVVVTADLATQRSAVKVSGWDVHAKDALTHEAGPSVLGAELGSDESGASLLASKLAERKESVVHTVPQNSDEAKAQAEACFRQMARRFVVARGTAQTDAKLRVGGRVELSGVGPLFTGTYTLVDVKHVFDGAKGLRTDFVAERPGLGRPS